MPGYSLLGSQGIHNKEVELTCGYSLAKLKERYPINTDETLNAIRNYQASLVKKLDELKQAGVEINPDNKIGTAIRFLDRFTNKENPDYLSDDGNHERQFQLREAMYLSWASMHDAAFSDQLESALEMFIDTCYENQRQYNLNKQGVDDHDEDDYPSCLGGSINRLVNARLIYDATLIPSFDDNDLQKGLEESVNVAFLQLVKQEKNKPESSNTFTEEFADKAISEGNVDTIKPFVEAMMKDKFGNYIAAEKLEGLLATIEYVNLTDESIQKATQLLAEPNPTARANTQPANQVDNALEALERHRVHFAEPQDAQAINQVAQTLSNASQTAENRMRNTVKLIDKIQNLKNKVSQRFNELLSEIKTSFAASLKQIKKPFTSASLFSKNFVESIRSKLKKPELQRASNKSPTKK